MKITIAWLFLLLLATGAAAQSPADRRAERQQQKEKQARLDDVQHRNAVRALEQRSFILQADRLYFKGGGMTTIEPKTNFLILDKDKVTVQVSFERYGGRGVALQGDVVRIREKQDRKGRLSYRIDISSTERSLTRVNLILNAESDQAMAVVYSDSNYNTFGSKLANYNDRYITLEGELKPLENNDILQRKPLF